MFIQIGYSLYMWGGDRIPPPNSDNSSIRTDGELEPVYTDSNNYWLFVCLFCQLPSRSICTQRPFVFVKLRSRWRMEPTRLNSDAHPLYVHPHRLAHNHPPLLLQSGLYYSFLLFVINFSTL